MRISSLFRPLSALALPILCAALPAQTPTFVSNPQNGSEYALTPLLSWTDAQAFAQRFGGNLVTIDDASEQAFLLGTFGIQNLWIGLNDVNQEGVYEWVDGSPSTYRNWCPGEPNAFSPDEDYVHIANFPGFCSGQWNDQQNSDFYRGVIERRVRRVRLSDNFNDNMLDASLWNTVACDSQAFLNEVNGRIEFGGRMHLVTNDDFDPSVDGEITVRARVILNSVGQGGDEFVIATRATGDTQGPDCTSLSGLNAVLFEGTTLRLEGTGTLSGMTSAPFQYAVGDVLDIELADRGNTARFKVMNQTAGTSAELSLNVGGTASGLKVEFYGRQAPFVSTAFLDDVIIESRFPSDFNTFGAGCVSSNGTTPNVGANPPRIGQTFNVRTAGIAPNVLGTLYLATDDQSFAGLPLPLDATNFGAPGCQLLVNADEIAGALPVAAPSNASGVSFLVFGVPLQSTLLGVELFVQHVSMDMVPGRSLPLTFSNAARSRIGS